MRSLHLGRQNAIRAKFGIAKSESDRFHKRPARLKRFKIVKIPDFSHYRNLATIGTRNITSAPPKALGKIKSMEVTPVAFGG